MKRIAALAVAVAAGAGCDFDNDLTIDNRSGANVLVEVGRWEMVGEKWDPDTGTFEPVSAWTVGAFRVAVGERKAFTFTSEVEVNIYREPDMMALFHDTRLWDETIVVHP